MACRRAMAAVAAGLLAMCSPSAGFAIPSGGGASRTVGAGRAPAGVMALAARPPPAFAPALRAGVPWAVGPGRGPRRGRPQVAPPMQMSAPDGEGGKPYTIVDSKLDHTVVMPISEETTSRMIECKITKACLFLSVEGQRIIDGEMWGEVVPDDSSWEIDEYGDEDRCIVIRLRKKSKEDWPYVVRGDYDMEAADWANRRVVSRETIAKEDVEAALQLIVSLLKPSGLAPAATPAEEAPAAAPEDNALPGEEPLKKLPEVPGSTELKQEWEQMVLETKEEEWRDTADAMTRAFSDGRSSDEIQELLSVTQEALQVRPLLPRPHHLRLPPPPGRTCTAICL